MEKEGQQANPEEQELLAKYVGWGGLANEFFDELNPKYEAERLTLKSLVSKSEYSTMKQSSLTAYYTDPMIIRQIWQKLLDDGFEGGRILDPSMGFRVIIMTQANSQVNTRVLELLPKFKIKKMNRWCAV